MTQDSGIPPLNPVDAAVDFTGMPAEDRQAFVGDLLWWGLQQYGRGRMDSFGHFVFVCVRDFGRSEPAIAAMVIERVRDESRYRKPVVRLLKGSAWEGKPLEALERVADEGEYRPALQDDKLAQRIYSRKSLYNFLQEYREDVKTAPRLTDARRQLYARLVQGALASLVLVGIGPSTAAAGTEVTRRTVGVVWKAAATIAAFSGIAVLLWCDGDDNEEARRTPREVVDRSPEASAVADGFDPAGKGDCTSLPTERQQKKCFLSQARALRASDYDGAVRGYEAAVSIDYEPVAESMRETLEAFRELAALHVKHRAFAPALSAFTAYVEHLPYEKQQDADCYILFALHRSVGASREAHDAKQRCRSGRGTAPQPPQRIEDLAWSPESLDTASAAERDGDLAAALVEYVEAVSLCQRAGQEWCNARVSSWYSGEWAELFRVDGVDDVATFATDNALRLVRVLEERGLAVRANRLLAFRYLRSWDNEEWVGVMPLELLEPEAKTCIASDGPCNWRLDVLLDGQPHLGAQAAETIVTFRENQMRPGLRKVSLTLTTLPTRTEDDPQLAQEFEASICITARMKVEPRSACR